MLKSFLIFPKQKKLKLTANTKAKAKQQKPFDFYNKEIQKRNTKPKKMKILYT
jgi:hypothetical protein